MKQDVFDSIVQWFLYKEYPSHITKRDEKKNWKKKMKKYNYKEENTCFIMLTTRYLLYSISFPLLTYIIGLEYRFTFSHILLFIYIYIRALQCLEE